MKALVVDDQATSRAILSRILRVDLGCTVVEAAHGEEAIALLERHPFDVMVLDVMMPVLDGIDTLERVRRMPLHRHLPVVVLSAVRDEPRVRRMVQLGIAGYLVKPLRPLDVAHRLKRLFPSIEPEPLRELPYEPPVCPPAALRTQLVAATVRVFGMRLGLEVRSVDHMRATEPGEDVATVPLLLPGQAHDLLFAVQAPRAVTERMTAQALRGGDSVGDAAVAATMRELATVIGSRLQSGLRERGHAVTLGTVSATRAGGESVDDLDDAALAVTFASPSQGLCFTTVLRPTVAFRPAATRGLHAEPVARTLTMDMSTLPPPVDAEVLDMLASLQEPGEPDLLVELVSLFLRDTPERLRGLEIRPLDGGSVVRIAHAVKGSAGNLGAMHLQELAGNLEQAAHQGRGSDELAALATTVSEEFARVAAYLRGVLATRADDGLTH